MLAKSLLWSGAFSEPALLPSLMSEWSLSNTEAGWLTGIFYVGYAVSVPVLMSLTDYVDLKRIYLLGVATITISTPGFAYSADDFYSAFAFRGQWGLGWAETYMPGLKALRYIVEGPQQSRAVSAHAASVGVSDAAFFLIPEAIGAWYGWRLGTGVGSIGAALSFVIVFAVLRGRKPERKRALREHC